MPDAHQQSPEYERGPAQGGAQKLKYIRDERRGWLLLLLLIALFVIPHMHDSYNKYQIEREKVKACAHATDVTACVTAVGK